MMDYSTVQEASVRWRISERHIQKLCDEQRIPGTVRIGSRQDAGGLCKIHRLVSETDRFLPKHIEEIVCFRDG